MKELTKMQILERVRRRFSNPANRALDSGGTCVYETERGENCGVGMFLSTPHRFTGSIEMIQFINGENVQNIDKQFKTEARGHSIEFWADVQRWHDKASHFNIKKNCISRSGAARMRRLKSKWNNNYQ